MLHMLPSDFSFTPASDLYNPLMFHTPLIEYAIHQTRETCELQQKNINNFVLVAWLLNFYFLPPKTMEINKGIHS
jgi:homogentisate 1,2-dioxygenase